MDDDADHVPAASVSISGTTRSPTDLPPTATQSLIAGQATPLRNCVRPPCGVASGAGEPHVPLVQVTAVGWPLSVEKPSVSWLMLGPTAVQDVAVAHDTEP